tara:strand:- start:2152 stop:2676 length:525 start_codon:yes stop_codon:yes gene_type:complete
MRKKFDITDYDIVFSGLKEGKYDYVFKADELFFRSFQFYELEDVNIQVKTLFIKKNSMLELYFNSIGSCVLTCDISNEKFSYQLNSDLNFVIKFGENYNDDNDQYIIIPHNSYKFNVAKSIYEMIVLSIPLKKVHPGVIDGSLKSKTVKILNDLSPGTKKTESDPRWNKLKDYL